MDSFVFNSTHLLQTVTRFIKRRYWTGLSVTDPKILTASELKSVDPMMNMKTSVVKK